MKLVFLDKKTIGDDMDFAQFHELGEIVEYDFTSPEEVPARVSDADVVIVNKVPVNAQTIHTAQKLKLVCVTATGTNNLDKDYLAERGIEWRNAAGYSTESVAQHTFAMLFYLMEHLRYYDDYVKEGAYGAQERFSNFDLPFVELREKIWGIVGMGHIGQKVAAIARAFGCEVIFYSASGKSTCTDYRQVDLDTLLKTADFLSLHCPLSERTRGLIDKDALHKMKKTAVLLNVARGSVIVQSDLYWALQNGEIAAAGLDVLEKEPITSDNLLGRIQDSNKLLITPHMAWAATEARVRIVEEVYQNIEAYLQGRDRNIVSC